MGAAAVAAFLTAERLVPPSLLGDLKVRACVCACVLDARVRLRARVCVRVRAFVRACASVCVSYRVQFVCLRARVGVSVRKPCGRACVRQIA